MDRPPIKSPASDLPRLAIVASHPTQYYAPWFAHLTEHLEAEIKVFYLWEFGAKRLVDPKFNQAIKWDIDLIKGYESEWVPNKARNPGTHHFRGLQNPALISRMRRWNPNHVLVFGYGWWSMQQLAWRWRNCPLILRGDSNLIARPNPSQNPLERLRRWLLRLVLKRFTSFATVGRANRDFYLALGVPATRLHHVPHCVDNERFASASLASRDGQRRLMGAKDGETLILFAGKFEPKKRPDLLVQAFRQTGLPDSRLVLLGNGPMRPQLEAMAKSETKIQLMPFANQQAMPAILAAADLVVLPSQGSGETWGLIVNEAMAAGTPVLVSDHVGCAQDLVVEGKTGWVFPAGDLAQLSKTLTLAQTAVANRRGQFRQATRDHVASFSYTTATQQMSKLMAANSF